MLPKTVMGSDATKLVVEEASPIVPTAVSIAVVKSAGVANSTGENGPTTLYLGVKLAMISHLKSGDQLR